MRHVAGHHRHLGLQVATPGLVGQRDRITRPEEPVGAALIHQRVGPEAFGHVGGPRLPHQGHVVHIGRAVGPLIGARQRAGGVVLVETFARHGAMLEALGQTAQQGLGGGPVVERRL